MPSQNKLIKQGIYLTDSLFDEIIKRLGNGVKSSDTLESFLDKTKNYTMNNPLVVSGYKDKLIDIILKETNNHKFSRPAQKELTRLTIENRVGDLIVDVGEDIKNNVRDIVKHDYNNNLSQNEIADNISKKITNIKNTRARTIARTEIARTATASDYIINKERGATHFTVNCRDTCCDICKKHYNFGKKEYTIDEIDMLPPLHPNCRCYTTFYIKKDYSDIGNTDTLKNENGNSSYKTRLNGTPKISTKTEQTERVTIYTFGSGLKLSIGENANFTYEEIVNHINSLPEPLRNIETLKEIRINGYYSSGAGKYAVGDKTIDVYLDGRSKSGQLDTLTHELAHALDNSKSTDEIRSTMKLSHVDVYEKIFKADNKMHTYISANGKKKTPKKFATDYARRSWKKYKRKFSEAMKTWKAGTQDPVLKPEDNRFTEDFAESTKLYLNPYEHTQFVKDFPNRAEYLKGIYGKPKFDKNSTLYKLLVEEGVL